MKTAINILHKARCATDAAYAGALNTNGVKKEYLEYLAKEADEIDDAILVLQAHKKKSNV